MSEQKKPREYGVSGETAMLLEDDWNIEQCKDYVAQYGRYGDPEPIHVIEYAALTELQAKYDELEKLFAKLSSDAERTEELYDSLKASADKLRDALEKEMGDGGLRISEEALAEYEAWKKEKLK